MLRIRPAEGDRTWPRRGCHEAGHGHEVDVVGARARRRPVGVGRADRSRRRTTSRSHEHGRHAGRGGHLGRPARPVGDHHVDGDAGVRIASRIVPLPEASTASVLSRSIPGGRTAAVVTVRRDRQRTRRPRREATADHNGHHHAGRWRHHLPVLVPRLRDVESTTQSAWRRSGLPDRHRSPAILGLAMAGSSLLEWFAGATLPEVSRSTGSRSYVTWGIVAGGHRAQRLRHGRTGRPTPAPASTSC